MFSTLLPEVISKYVFPFLHVNDLLRLRRVSKVSKELADDYLRVYGTSKRVVFIDLNENSDDLTNFLALTYPITLTRFDLVNEYSCLLNRKELQVFLGLYGEKITHLEIYRLAIPIESPKTVQFFNGLPNLQELKIEELEGEVGSHVSPNLNLTLPSTFQRLKHLHLEFSSCHIQMLRTFIFECSAHLERLHAPDEAFEWVRRIVESRHREDPDKPNLKCYEHEDCRDQDIFSNSLIPVTVRKFNELVTTCAAHNVKLQNVDARLIEEMMELDTADRRLQGDKISRCVVSIQNLTKSLFHSELTLLEKIHIHGTSQCSMPEGDFERQPWKNLKELKVHVNSEYLAEDGDNESDNDSDNEIDNDGDVYRLFGFLFHGIHRVNLETLELSFGSDDDVDILPYPTMTSVCSSCPNLKKLHLLNWPGNNREISQLWGNLPLLENVTFERCENLGDAAFIGNDDTRPALLKATRLKSLKFSRQPKRWGITDNLFTSVLRHMPLKALYLKTYWPASQFTLAGLESLLTGKFAETIENFPLKGRIQLEGVAYEQLAELEGKFRSSKM